MKPAPEPLEDDFTWVLRKALKGRNLAPAQAAELAGLPPSAVLALSRGHFDPATARQLAPALGLDPDALANHPHHHPQPALPAGVARFAFPYDGGSVNAWLVRHHDAAILIDAGPEPGALRRALTSHAAAPTLVLLTHPHHDHLGGLGGLPRPTPPIHAPAAARLPGTHDLTPGTTLACGPLTVHAVDLGGHCRGQLGFLIDGLDTPVCAVGDALFAGSVGGTPDPHHHQLQLDLLRRHVLSLPSATLLLPGHGPPTTVALERAHNPFLAGQAAS